MVATAGRVLLEPAIFPSPLGKFTHKLLGLIVFGLIIPVISLRIKGPENSY